MISSLLTVKQKIEIVNKIKSDWSATSSNTYVGIGRVAQWSTSDISIPIVDNSIDSVNGVFDNLIAIKKITDNDMASVVPRIDWQTSTKYYAYDNTLDIFSKSSNISISNGSITISISGTTVVGTSTSFTNDFTAGDMIEYRNTTTNARDIREIISIENNTSMTINSAFGVSLTTSSYSKVYDTSPGYSYPFYVRNSYDQVFKCLANTTLDGSGISTVMPTISLGGNLPQNPFIITADGYKWKYLYTIPSGLKRKFYTNDWMPVISDLVVTTSSVDGSIDVIKIINGGTGYNQNVACTNASIITVTGNGADLNVSAVVDTNGTITDINILNGGRDYTYATVTASAGLYGQNANLIPVIGPNGGNGSNPNYELGATTFMLCLELESDEGGFIPISSSGGTGIFDYHQISIIRNPKTRANTFVTASNSVYSVTKTVTMNPFGSTIFQTDDIAYQSNTTLSEAYFTASIVGSDTTIRKVYLNNIRGTFNENDSLRTVLTGASIAPTGSLDSDIDPYSGDVLFIENRPGVGRSVDQTEQIKLIIQV